MNSSFVYDGFGRVGFGFGWFETIFPIFFILIFALVFIGIIYSVISSAKQYHKNNMSPVLSVDAKVIAKRTDVSYHHHTNTDNNFSDYSTSSTTYYVTFQVESNDRMEFHVTGNEFGVLAEGDSGKLKFQGTRFLEFTRL